MQGVPALHLACEAAWEEADNECTPEVAPFLELKVVCAACNGCAKDLWLARGRRRR